MNAVATGLSIVGYGILLGIGFWAGRKITDTIDVKLAEREAAMHLKEFFPPKQKSTKLYEGEKLNCSNTVNANA